MKIEILRKWGRLSVGLVCNVPSHAGNIMINRGYAKEVKEGAKAAKPQLRRRRRKKDDAAPAEAAEG